MNAKHTPINIRVTCDENRNSVSYDLDQAHYHVWLQGEPENLAIDGPLYKNPLKEVIYRTPGYFDTRRLDPHTTSNAAILSTVFAQVKARGLIDVARKEQAEREAKYQAEIKESYRISRLRDLGPKILPQVEAVLNDNLDRFYKLAQSARIEGKEERYNYCTEGVLIIRALLAKLKEEG